MVSCCFGFLRKKENYKITVVNAHGDTVKHRRVVYVSVNHLEDEIQLALNFYLTDDFDVHSIRFYLSELEVRWMSDHELWFSDGSQIVMVMFKRASDSLGLWCRIRGISDTFC